MLRARSGAVAGGQADVIEALAWPTTMSAASVPSRFSTALLIETWMALTVTEFAVTTCSLRMTEMPSALRLVFGAGEASTPTGTPRRLRPAPVSVVVAVGTIVPALHTIDADDATVLAFRPTRPRTDTIKSSTRVVDCETS